MNVDTMKWIMVKMLILTILRMILIISHISHFSRNILPAETANPLQCEAAADDGRKSKNVVKNKKHLPKGAKRWYSCRPVKIFIGIGWGAISSNFTVLYSLSLSFTLSYLDFTKYIHIRFDHAIEENIWNECGPVRVIIAAWSARCTICSY